MDVISDEESFIVPTYNRPPIVFHHGQGAYLFDTEGNRYLDFAAGIAVNALGHADPTWVAAISEQANMLGHVSNLFHSEPHVRLAKKLVATSFADRVFFCNSGTEANEAALKFSRKLSHTTGHQNKLTFVAFENSFHGRTFGALSVTHKPRYREPFAPLVPNVRFVPFNDIDAARNAIDLDTCAVIVEPVQGEGGVRPAAPEFLRALRSRCDETGTALIFDEVQCGLGRTGHLWAHQAHGVEPDILTAAKPLANGLPIGAVLVKESVAKVMTHGDHGSTFAGGPIVCRAAEVVLDRIGNPAFLEHVRATSTHLLRQLDRLRPYVTEIRASGLLVGLELDRPAAPIVQAARDQGLIIITAGETVIRLAPPLIVGNTEVDACVSTLERCLSAEPG